MRHLLPALVLVLLPATPGSTTPQEPPEHLAGVRDELAASRILVLAPPERPGGTTATVAEAEGHFYRLVFTNDPDGALAHAEQVNVFVTGTEDVAAAPPEALPIEVRGTGGSFHCGASACFLDWEEGEAAYSVGEFGAPEDAVAFAESLEPLEELVGEDLTGPEAEPAEEGAPLGPIIGGVAAGAAALAIVAWALARRRRDA